MPKYEAFWSNGDVQVPVKFIVDGEEGSERVSHFNPMEFRDQLSGQALLEHKNFQNLLKGMIYKLPSSITIIRVVHEA